MNTYKTAPLRPISTIVRKFGKASFQSGTFRMSEGYELRPRNRTQVLVRWYCNGESSCGFAKDLPASANKGREFMANAIAALTAAGFGVEVQDEFTIVVSYS